MEDEASLEQDDFSCLKRQSVGWLQQNDLSCLRRIKIEMSPPVDRKLLETITFWIVQKVNFFSWRSGKFAAGWLLLLEKTICSMTLLETITWNILQQDYFFSLIRGKFAAGWLLQLEKTILQHNDLSSCLREIANCWRPLSKQGPAEWELSFQRKTFLQQDGRIG